MQLISYISMSSYDKTGHYLFKNQIQINIQSSTIILRHSLPRPSVIGQLKFESPFHKPPTVSIIWGYQFSTQDVKV